MTYSQPAKPWTRRAASARAISSSLGSVVRPSVTKNFVLAQHYPSPVADAVRFAFMGASCTTVGLPLRQPIAPGTLPAELASGH